MSANYVSDESGSKFIADQTAVGENKDVSKRVTYLKKKYHFICRKENNGNKK